MELSIPLAQHLNVLRVTIGIFQNTPEALQMVVIPPASGPFGAFGFKHLADLEQVPQTDTLQREDIR
jgi:hypothetical protein